MTAEARRHASYQRYERLVSAGGVVYRLEGDRVEVLLCGRWELPLWSLPKGTPDPGEGIQDTARREVEEETGVKVAILGKLGSIRYFFTRVQDNTRCDKTVHHYLMQPIGGDPALHDREFDEVRWFPVEQALKVMTYPNEVAMVQKALAVVKGVVRLRRLPTRPRAGAAGGVQEAAHG